MCNMVTHARRSAQRGGEKGDVVVRCRAVHPASHGVVVRIRYAGSGGLGDDVPSSREVDRHHCGPAVLGIRHGGLGFAAKGAADDIEDLREGRGERGSGSYDLQ